MKLPINMEHGSIYINYDMGDDIPTVLRRIADNIVNGKIRFTGIERNEAEDKVYWVKDCGEYDLKILLPFTGTADLVYDVDSKRAICFYMRDKKK